MEFSFGVIILAAGGSTRMGRAKLLLPWGETTVLGHLLRLWTELGARQTGVVCAADASAIREELARLRFPDEQRIVNPAPERGMFGSIRCAAAWPGWNLELTHWVITLGDQPHLQRETLRRLLDFGRANPDRVCQPLRGGRRRHPVLLPRREFAELKTTSAADLKQFLAERETQPAGFESADAGLDFDMDTPADYERARKLAEQD